MARRILLLIALLIAMTAVAVWFDLGISVHSATILN